MNHFNYPHWPGTLYDCPACEEEMNDENIVLSEELNDESL